MFQIVKWWPSVPESKQLATERKFATLSEAVATLEQFQQLYPSRDFVIIETLQQEGKVTMSNAPLPNYYDAKRVGDKWNLTCEVCGKKWSLPIGNNHPGNILALLDHALSHNKRK
jgi:hypothetical protein